MFPIVNGIRGRLRRRCDRRFFTHLRGVFPSNFLVCRQSALPLDWGLLFFSGSRLNLKERVRTACGNLVFRHQKFIDRHGTPSTHSGGMPPAPAGADSESQGVERSATPGKQFQPDSALRPERQLSVGNALLPECGWIGHPSPGVALRFTPWLPDGLPPEDSKVWSSRFEFNRWLAEKSNPQSTLDPKRAVLSFFEGCLS